MLKKRSTILLTVIGGVLLFNFIRVLIISTERQLGTASFVKETYVVKGGESKKIHYVTTRASRVFIRKMGYQYEKRLPKALGIGVKKCGTTALLRFLDLHPDVVLPEKPELHFFDTNDYGRGTEYYRQRMPYTAPHEISIEKSPRYFVLKDVPLKVKRMNPKMKLLLVVCDPIKRAYSDFNFESHRDTMHLLKIKKSDPLPASFDEFVVSVLKQIETIKKYSKHGFSSFDEAVLNSWSPSRYYLTLLNTGIYSVYLKNWLKYFPLEQIHIINGEDLLTNPVKVLREAQTFLGLEMTVDDRDIVFDIQKGYYCIKRNRRDDLIQCMGEAKGTTRNKTISEMMNQGTLKSLQGFYKPYNDELFKIIGKKFDWT